MSALNLPSNLESINEFLLRMHFMKPYIYYSRLFKCIVLHLFMSTVSFLLSMAHVFEFLYLASHILHNDHPAPMDF